MKISEQLKICGEATEGPWIKLRNGEESEESHCSEWLRVGPSEDKVVCRIGYSCMIYGSEFGDKDCFTDQEIQDNDLFIRTARTKYPEALRLIEVLRKDVESVANQCALLSYTTAGIPEKRDEMMLYATWVGTLRKALAAIKEFEKESGK